MFEKLPRTGSTGEAAPGRTLYCYRKTSTRLICSDQTFHWFITKGFKALGRLKFVEFR